MTLTQLAPPYPIFTDKSGSPLDNGYLYFGTANLNPETNPITVYYDRGFTQPAAQPIRTSNGYVMRNGSPAIIYANSEFSVTVRDKKKALVIYSPVGFGVVPGVPIAIFDNAANDVAELLANTSFTYSTGVPNTVQVAAGDILRTLAEGFAYEVAASAATDQHVTTAGGVKLYVQPQSGEWPVLAFGVVANGVTSDGALINKAISAAFAAGGGAVILPPKVMATTTAIVPKANVFLRGIQGKTEIKATASMTAVFYGSTATAGFGAYGVVFNANSQASTSAVQLNQAAFTNVTFEDCDFKNSITAWTVLVGYAAGTPASPGSAATALATKSKNIQFNRCRFNTHASSTLEQFIIVNSQDVRVLNCIFDENNTNANSVFVYAFSSNVSINNCTFLNVQNNGIGVQESDNVWIDGNRFVGETAMGGRFVNLINCASVWVTNNSAKGTKASSPVFSGAYAEAGTTWESGNYLTQYAGCYDLTISGNKLDGCYSIAQIPQQKQADKTFVFEGIHISENTVTNCGGAPVILGNYTIVDPVTQFESIKRVRVCDNIIQDYNGFDEGWLYVVGTSTADIVDLTVSGNISAAPSSGTNGHAMRLSYVNNFQIVNNDCPGRGSRVAIRLENEEVGRVVGNNTQGFGLQFTADRPVHITDNLGATAAMERCLTWMQNRQGAQIDAGSVVILRSVTEQSQVTMTTTIADYRVFGVMLENTADTAYGWVVTKGRVSNLKANGATAIAIGDLLGCSNANGISRKSAAGSTAFAIAAEAYAVADNNGVLDALIVGIRNAP